MLAARDWLQTLLGLDGNSCEVMFDGYPKPSCGETFVAIHPGPWRFADRDACFEEDCTFFVTITRRLGYSPKDRWGTEVWGKANDGLEATLRKIIFGKPVKATSADRGLHMNDLIRENANTTYITASYGGFSEPVRILDGGRPEEKGPEWFSAVEAQEGMRVNAGVAQTLTFGGAKRIQGLPQDGFDQS